MIFIVFQRASGDSVARNRLTTSSYTLHLSSPSSCRLAGPVGWMGGWSVLVFCPRVGTALWFAITHSTSGRKTVGRIEERTWERSRVGG